MSPRFNESHQIVFEAYPDVSVSKRHFNTAAKLTVFYMGNLVVNQVEQRLPGGSKTQFEGWKSKGLMSRMLGVTRPVKKSWGYQVFTGFTRTNRHRRKALYAHEYGVTITPKRKKFLKFKGRDGKVVFTKSATIRRKRFWFWGWYTGRDEAATKAGPFFAKMLSARIGPQPS
jgi:hypothetical protein